MVTLLPWRIPNARYGVEALAPGWCRKRASIRNVSELEVLKHLEVTGEFFLFLLFVIKQVLEHPL